MVLHHIWASTGLQDLHFLGKKLVETSASLLVTSALLVVTMFASRNKPDLEDLAVATQPPFGPRRIANAPPPEPCQRRRLPLRLAT